MKFNSLAKTLVLGLAVLLATGAFASNKSSVHFEQAVAINGQQVAAGNYTLRWEGSGSDVQLSVMQGKKEVAKTAAKLVELDRASSTDAVVLNNTSGTPSVQQFRFGGKKTAINLESGDRASMSGSAK
ncbi:MAG TPA: hypothetical protein VMI10_11635 [Terriglobales bacterium]|nr:hypothetical protein [Terriglobales bacterium]